MEYPRRGWGRKHLLLLISVPVTVRCLTFVALPWFPCKRYLWLVPSLSGFCYKVTGFQLCFCLTGLLDWIARVSLTCSSSTLVMRPSAFSHCFRFISSYEQKRTRATEECGFKITSFQRAEQFPLRTGLAKMACFSPLSLALLSELNEI